MTILGEINSSRNRHLDVWLEDRGGFGVILLTNEIVESGIPLIPQVIEPMIEERLVCVRYCHELLQPDILYDEAHRPVP